MKIVSLNKRKDFDVLFSRGKRIFKKHLTVIYFFCSDDMKPGSPPMRGIQNRVQNKESIVQCSVDGSSGQAGGRQGREMRRRGSSNASDHLLKIAYIVSKKISPKAVVRNKIRRRIKAATNQVITKIQLEGHNQNRNIFIAILPSKKIFEIPFQQIYLESEGALKKLYKP